MKKLLLFFIIFISFSQVILTQTIVETKISQSGTSVSINVVDGNAWLQNYRDIKKRPQIVVWVEDVRHDFIETLFITKYHGQQEVISSSDILDIVYRKGTLPLWLGKQYTKTGTYPTKYNHMPDAVTSATPNGELIINTKVDKNIKEGYIYIEVNNMGDYNSRHTDFLYGQPSIVYRALVDFKKKNKTYDFEIIGSTSRNAEGVYFEHLNGVTSAKNIIRSATITVK